MKELVSWMKNSKIWTSRTACRRLESILKLCRRCERERSGCCGWCCCCEYCCCCSSSSSCYVVVVFVVVAVVVVVIVVVAVVVGVVVLLFLFLLLFLTLCCFYLCCLGEFQILLNEIFGDDRRTAVVVVVLVFQSTSLRRRRRRDLGPILQFFVVRQWGRMRKKSLKKISFLFLSSSWERESDNSEANLWLKLQSISRYWLLFLRKIFALL